MFPSPANIRFVCHSISLTWSSFPRGQSLRCRALAGPEGKSGRGSLAAGAIRSRAMLDDASLHRNGCQYRSGPESHSTCDPLAEFHIPEQEDCPGSPAE